VYERVPGRALPASLGFLDPPAAAFFKSTVAGLGDQRLWWAAVDIKTEIELELVNPNTGRAFFGAGPESTYWLNKWMNPYHYLRYQRTQEKRWSFLPWWFPGNSRTPALPTGYRLRYRINGKSYPEW
jgi:hypothetical protein